MKRSMALFCVPTWHYPTNPPDFDVGHGAAPGKQSEYLSTNEGGILQITDYLEVEKAAGLSHPEAGRPGTVIIFIVAVISNTGANNAGPAVGGLIAAAVLCFVKKMVFFKDDPLEAVFCFARRGMMLP
jgi:hypothetical protein